MNVMYCCQTELPQLVAEEMSDWIWMDAILHLLQRYLLSSIIML